MRIRAQRRTASSNPLLSFTSASTLNIPPLPTKKFRRGEICHTCDAFLKIEQSTDPADRRLDRDVDKLSMRCGVRVDAVGRW